MRVPLPAGRGKRTGTGRIARTGLQDQEVKCRAAGFDYYVLKPADPVALAALIARCAKR